VGGVVGLTAPP